MSRAASLLGGGQAPRLRRRTDAEHPRAADQAQRGGSSGGRVRPDRDNPVHPALGIIQFILWFWGWQAGGHAAREAARVAAVTPLRHRQDPDRRARGRSAVLPSRLRCDGERQQDLAGEGRRQHHRCAGAGSSTLNLGFFPRASRGDIDKSATSRVENVRAGGARHAFSCAARATSASAAGSHVRAHGRHPLRGRGLCRRHRPGVRQEVAGADRRRRRRHGGGRGADQLGSPATRKSSTRPRSTSAKAENGVVRSVPARTSGGTPATRTASRLQQLAGRPLGSGEPCGLRLAGCFPRHPTASTSMPMRLPRSRLRGRGHDALLRRVQGCDTGQQSIRNDSGPARLPMPPLVAGFRPAYNGTSVHQRSRLTRHAEPARRRMSITLTGSRFTASRRSGSPVRPVTTSTHYTVPMSARSGENDQARSRSPVPSRCSQVDDVWYVRCCRGTNGRSLRTHSASP